MSRQIDHVLVKRMQAFLRQVGERLRIVEERTTTWAQVKQC